MGDQPTSDGADRLVQGKPKKVPPTWGEWLLNLMYFIIPESKPKPVLKTFDCKKVYWDYDGNLRQGLSKKKREDEVLRVLERDDNDDEDPQTVWMIIPSLWVRNWLLFAHFKLRAEAPGPIDISSLIKRDASCVKGDNYATDGWRPKSTLKPPTKTKLDTGDFAKEEYELNPGQYRRVSRDVWDALVDLYGLTQPQFCIAVKGNTKKTPASDLKRWRIFDSPCEVREEDLPEPEVEDAETLRLEAEHKRKIFAAQGFS